MALDPNQSPNQAVQVDSKTLFWNRLQLILILVVFVAPIAGAFFYKPSKFTNYGDLYTPVRPVENLIMSDTNGNVLDLASLRRQWVFLVVASKQCSQACEENLLKMRQLRFMQNNDMKRIRTVFLSADLVATTVEDLDKKYHPIESYRVEGADFERWSKVLELIDAPEAANQDRFYIIDPTGNLMMSYPSSADPNIMKKDIKRLLKASQIG